MTSLAAVVDAVGDGLRAESAEDHRVHRADARAGQHGDGRLGHHGQVDEDAVARLEAVALEHVGEPADLVMKLLVGEGALFARLAGSGGLALPDQRGLIRPRRAQVPVEAVVADIELAADEPLRVGLLPFQRPGPALEPDELGFGLPAPELLGRLDGLAIQFAILGERLDLRLPGEAFRGRKHTLFVQDGIKASRYVGCGHNNQRFIEPF